MAWIGGGAAGALIGAALSIAVARAGAGGAPPQAAPLSLIAIAAEGAKFSGKKIAKVWASAAGGGVEARPAAENFGERASGRGVRL